MNTFKHDKRLERKNTTGPRCAPVSYRGRKILVMALAVLLSLPMLPSFVDAGQHAGSSATLQVSASVRGFISLQVHSQMSELVVTAEDVRRGYIDVKTGTRFFVRTNVGEGYLLKFDVHEGGPFRKIEVNDGSRAYEVTGAGGLLPMTYSGGPTGELKELSYRFYLSHDARLGVYSWPVPIGSYMI